MRLAFDQILNEAARTPWLDYAQRMRCKITDRKVSMCDLKALWMLYKGHSIHGHEYNTKRRHLRQAGLLLSYPDPTGEREPNGKVKVAYGLTPDGQAVIQSMIKVIDGIAKRMHEAAV